MGAKVDVINVVSVVQPAKVNQWIESDDEEIQDAMYWRQAFDCQTSQLSVCLQTSSLRASGLADRIANRVPC